MKKHIVLCVALAACQDAPAESGATEIAPPDDDLNFVGGYRSADDDCQLSGESAFTLNYLDDAADLVSCPTGSEAAQSLLDNFRASPVAESGGYTLYSVSRR